MRRPRTIEAGERFGRLTVTTTRVPSQTHVECVCDCGTAHRVVAYNWGRTRSCGCLQREEVARRSTIHGRSGTPSYTCWWNMIQRCSDPRNKYWLCYGGRGITVCDRWTVFVHFYADMGDRPPGLTLDRIDNERGYFPGNCRWATPAEQARNKRPREPSGKRVLLTCSWCAAEFTRLAWRVKPGRPCCSRSCAVSVRNVARGRALDATATTLAV